LAKIVSGTYPDPTQFDRKSNYYDAKSSKDEPRWLTLDIQITAKCELIDLKTLREHKALSEMLLLRRGNRLSITPVAAKHWRYINSKLVEKIG